jgi:hypothetical protein
MSNIRRTHHQSGHDKPYLVACEARINTKGREFKGRKTNSNAITECFNAKYTSKSFSSLVGTDVPVFSLYGSAWRNINRTLRPILRRVDAAQKRKNQPSLRDAGLQNGADYRHHTTPLSY